MKIRKKKVMNFWYLHSICVSNLNFHLKFQTKCLLVYKFKFTIYSTDSYSFLLIVNVIHFFLIFFIFCRKKSFDVLNFFFVRSIFKIILFLKNTIFEGVMHVNELDGCCAVVMLMMLKMMTNDKEAMMIVLCWWLFVYSCKIL